MIRSDNGCQMTSRRYVKALQDAGIKHERKGLQQSQYRDVHRTLVPDTERGDGVASGILLFLGIQKRHRPLYPVLQCRARRKTGL
jgi:hypothetical protein